MTPFEQFTQEINKNVNQRRAIKFNRKLNYMITKERLNYLFKDYFILLTDEGAYQTFYFRKKDVPVLLVLLRLHFKLWIEFKKTGNLLKVYKKFPSTFIITKEVNKQNHWFTPETFTKGTILYFTKNNFDTVNWLNGIPLSKSLKPVEGTNIIPSTQINYEFIVPIIN